MQLVARPGKNGSLIASRDDFLFLFDRDAPQPAVGESVEAMITYHRRARDGGLSALVVRPVTADDVLVRHAGFVCRRVDGATPTTAMIYADDSARIAEKFGVSVHMLTPGRSPVAKSRYFPNGTFNLLRPGHAYMAKADLLQGLSRICGLPTLDDVDETLLGKPLRGMPARAAMANVLTFRKDFCLSG